jgi:hypothetical protein
MKERIKFLQGEKWKIVKSLENINSNHYAVSNLGRMVSYTSSLEKGYPMLVKDFGSGYLKTKIKSKNGTSAKSVNLHILMAETFLLKPPGKDYVIHKDGNLSNNLLINLQWVSRTERNDHTRQDLMKGWYTSKKKKFELLPGEEWKVIKSLENIRKARNYAASNMGRIAVFRKTLPDGQLMKPVMFRGYALIHVNYIDDIKKHAKRFMVNRLVAECFLPPRAKGEKLVIHKDFKRANNVVSNLKWVTPGESISRHKHPDYKPRAINSPFKKFVNEKWMTIKSIEGIGKMHYAVSSLGRLASYFKSFDEDARLIKGSISKGQKVLRISDKVNGKNTNRSFSLHRLMAEYFLPPPEKDQLYLIHKDYNKLNNIPSNLQWVNANDLDKHAKKSEGYLAFLKVNHGRQGKGIKLTETRVKLLKRLLANPDNKTRMKMLAKRFNIAKSTLYRIKNGKAWSHIKKL